MALQHAVSGEKIALARGGDALAHFTSVALAKTEHMELIRLVLLKERPMLEHKVDGEMTLQCLEGAIAFDAQGRTVILKPGELLYLAGGVPHALRALDDAVALLTILLTPARDTLL